MSRADDLLAFIEAGQSPFHAVAEMARRLEAAGFTALTELTSGSSPPATSAT